MLNGKETGKLIGEFFQELRAGGIPHQDALELSRVYLQGLSSGGKLLHVPAPAYHPGIDPHEWADQPKDDPIPGHRETRQDIDPHE